MTADFCKTCSAPCCRGPIPLAETDPNFAFLRDRLGSAVRPVIRRTSMSPAGWELDAGPGCKLRGTEGCSAYGNTAWRCRTFPFSLYAALLVSGDQLQTIHKLFLSGACCPLIQALKDKGIAYLFVEELVRFDGDRMVPRLPCIGPALITILQGPGNVFPDNWRVHNTELGPILPVMKHMV